MKPLAPALVGPLRRRRRVHADALSTTWEAWDTNTGERLLVRVLRPEAPDVAVPAQTGLRVEPGEDGVRYLRTGPVGCSLADLLPLEGAPGAAWSARLALGLLSGLVAVHASGHAHGWVGAESAVSTARGWTLAWLGPVPDARAEDDLRALGVLVGALDPDGPVGELVGGFAEDPPPSAADAARLVVHACAGVLARERHDLVLRARALGRASRRARLAGLAQRLERACPPPVASGRVRVDAAGIALRVESDGARVRGARELAEAPHDAGFDVVGPGGIDPAGVRAVLRAWAAEEGRADDPAVAALVRWLAAAARLRTDRRILAYQTTVSR